jgi:hypothetical protein
LAHVMNNRIRIALASAALAVAIPATVWAAGDVRLSLGESVNVSCPYNLTAQRTGQGSYRLTCEPINDGGTVKPNPNLPPSVQPPGRHPDRKVSGCDKKDRKGRCK